MSKTTTTPAPTKPPTDMSVIFRPNPPRARPSPPSLGDWLDRLRGAVDVLRQPAKYIHRPADGTALGDDALTLLLDAFAMFRVPTGEILPLHSAARTFGGNCSGESRCDALADAALDVLTGLEQTIAAQLTAGHPDQLGRVFRIEDFADHRTLGLPDGAGGTMVVYVGVIASLPVDHPLRTVLDQRDPLTLYQLDLTLRAPTPETVGKAALICGPGLRTQTGSLGQPSKFYFLADALGWTANLRHQQVERLTEDRRRDRLEEQQRVNDWWASPAGKAEAARRELERLRAIPGGIPAEPKYEPAIRGGQIVDRLVRNEQKEESKP